MDRAEPIAQTSDEAPPELSKRTIVASVVKRGGPRLLEASFIPSALFWTALTFGSIGVAYAVAICSVRFTSIQRPVAGASAGKAGGATSPLRLSEVE